jgi:hypothetical protein
VWRVSQGVSTEGQLVTLLTGNELWVSVCLYASCAWCAGSKSPTRSTSLSPTASLSFGTLEGMGHRQLGVTARQQVSCRVSHKVCVEICSSKPAISMVVFVCLLHYVLWCRCLSIHHPQR